MLYLIIYTENFIIMRTNNFTAILPYNSGFITLLVIVWFLLSTNYSIAQKNYEIRKIKLNGLKVLEKEDILTNTTMYESNWFNRVIQKKEPALYNPEFLRADTERIRLYYQSQGFINASVAIDSVKANDKKQTVDIILSIIENKPVKVDSVSFDITTVKIDNPSDTSVKRITRKITLIEGKRFTDNELHADIENINYFFKNQGFMYVETDFDLKLNADTSLTDIFYRVNTGEKCTFGVTQVAGNRYITEKVIRRQFKYKEGDIFSKKNMEASRKQMYDLHLFKVVSFTPVSDKLNQKNPIPVKVFIQEMPRWSSKFGVGYGTEDKFRAFSDFTYRGIAGGSSSLNFLLKYSALTPYYASLSWIEPHFLMHKLSLSVNPYAKREAEPGYTTSTYGVNLPATYGFTDKIKTTLTYYIEKVSQEIESGDTDVPNPEDKDYLYNKSGLSASCTFNYAKPLMTPEKGWVLSVGAKINGYIFGSDFNYTRLWTDVRSYQQLGKFSFGERIMLGAIRSADAMGFIPVEDRWYSGGGTSNRGWARSAIGPKRESGSPIGGKSIFETNLEIKHPLIWKLDIAAFMDASNVWTDSYYYRFDNLDVAVGGGLRLNTPIGPVRVDVGVPVWNEKRRLQLFLSVGHAF